jgi:hypothetical protein
MVDFGEGGTRSNGFLSRRIFPIFLPPNLLVAIPPGITAPNKAFVFKYAFCQCHDANSEQIGARISAINTYVTYSAVG